MKTITINRAKWRCGEIGKFQKGKGSTCLLNGEGYMCCLGFATKQLTGCEEAVILNKLNPRATNMPIPYLTDIDDIHTPSNLSAEAININDRRDLIPEERESALTGLFAQHDLTLEFTGQYEN